MEKCVCKSIAVFVVCVLVLPAQTPQAEHTVLDDQRVMTLSRSLSRSELVSLIMSAPEVSFELSPAAMDAMMKAGVSEDVIKAMAARESGTRAPQLPATPRSVPAAKPVTATPAAMTVAIPAKAAPRGKHSGNSYNIT